MAYFSDKGKHCDVSACQALDFLPFECTYCSRTFCLAHFKTNDHDCGKVAEHDRRVIVCEDCGKSLRLTVEEPGSILAAHKATGDECELARQLKSPLKICGAKNCRQTLTVSNKYECKICGLMVCLKHRLRGDHECKPENRVKNRPPMKSVAEYLRRKLSSRAK